MPLLGSVETIRKLNSNIILFQFRIRDIPPRESQGSQGTKTKIKEKVTKIIARRDENYLTKKIKQLKLEKKKANWGRPRNNGKEFMFWRKSN